MDDVAVVIDAGEKPAQAARQQPSRQGSLRLRSLAPGSINVLQAGDGSCHAAAEVIPLLTPLHVVPAAESSAAASGRHLPAPAASRQLHAEIAAAGGRCVAVEKTRWAASWWHPAMPFVNDQPAAASVGFVFQNCV